MHTHSTTAVNSLEKLTRAEFWQQHLDRCMKSGMSKIKYCQQYQLAYHQLMYWQKRLSTKKALDSSTIKSTDSRLVPVVVGPQPTTAAGLSLSLPNGIQITGITEHTLNCVKPLLAQL